MAQGERGARVKGIKITPDLISSCGMAIALILAILLGTSPEVTIGIAGGLSGYLGQVIQTGEDKAAKKGKENE